MRATLVGRLKGAALAALFVLPVLSPSAGIAASDKQIAVLQGLDKVTARISTFEAPVNETVKFGTLEIVARRCQKSDPEDLPESAAFLQVSEAPLESAEKKSVFSGWMFASSPALSALEHPVYDVWVIDCK